MTQRQTSNPDQAAEILEHALNLQETERSQYLKSACGGDAALRSEVESLLEAHAQQGEFLANPSHPGAVAAGETVTADRGRSSESVGAIIGRYKLLQLIGEGGFGSVYMAEQREPVQRKVALKIIKLGMDTRQVIARFEAERQALAMMDHPNIAKVLDAGATDFGRPYFVMELVRGEPITHYCDKNNLTVDQRLGLFQQVCHAVQHAHQKGIIHRDIKPSNVMITLHDGRPVPKVIDFGIAKATNARLTEKTVFTEYRQFIGTPEYMSPEQAEMSGIDIDTRSDVYSLGVLLYELLTGTTPFDGKKLRSAGYGEIQRIIREETPHKPSTRLSTLDTLPSIAAHRQIEPKKLGLVIRGDLDWIVMKSLEKDRTRRYETANGFAMDIERYLKDEPVTATPPSAGYKLKKLVKRNKGAFAAAAAVLAVLTLGAMGTTWGMLWAMNERERVATQADRASGALRQVTDEFSTTLVQSAANVSDVPIVASTKGGEVEALARTAVNLVRTIDASRQETQRQAAAASAVSDFLVTLFKTSDPSQARGAEITAREILDRGVERIRTELRDQPEVQTRLMDVLGNVYQNLGLFDEAGPLLEKALERRRQLHGPDSAEVAETQSKLAWNLMRTGEPAEAERLYRDVLRIQRSRLPGNHAEVADALSNLAGPLVDLGRHEEARDLYRQSLQIRRDDPDTTDEHLAGSLANLAMIDRALGDLDESITMMKESGAILRRIYPEDHPDLAKWSSAYGLTLRDAGRSAEALPYLRNALAIGEKVYGQENADVGTFANNLALALQELGEFAEAEAMYRRVVAIDRATLPPDHPYLAMSIDNLAVLLHDLKRYDEAEPLYAEALRIRRSKFGMEHQETVISVNNLAVLAKDRGDLAKAEAMFRESLRIRLRLYTPPHAQIAIAMTNLADVLAQTGKVDEAEQMYRDGLAMRIAALGEEHPAVADSKVRLAQLLATLGRIDEAETLDREALDLRRRVQSAGHWSLAQPLQQLAQIEVKRGRFAPAEPMLLEAYEIRSKAFGAKDARVRVSVVALIDLYNTWHEAHPEAGYDAKAATWRATLEQFDSATTTDKTKVSQ